MRFGVIGTNFITEWMLAEAQKRSDFQLEAVYSRDLLRAKEFGQKYGANKAYDDLEGLYADPEVDVIYIASPNCCHYEQAMGALRHGKHVLVEKPAVASEAEFADLLHAAKENGVLLLEAMRPAHSPGLKQVRQYMQEIMPVRLVRISYCQYSSRYDAFKEGRVLNAFNPMLQNGSLMDIGVYCIHVLAALFGEPEALYAQALRLSNGIDGAGTITAVYPGMLAQITHSKICNSRTDCELQGEGGTLVIDEICSPKLLVLHKRGAEPLHIPVPDADFGLGVELDVFLRLLSEGGAESFQADTRIALRMMDEIRRQTGIDFS